MGFSRPKEKPLFEVSETELFVSGIGAKRPGSQVRDSGNKLEGKRKNQMMGTWGPVQHKSKQFGF